MARAKRIYLLMIKVNKLIFVFASRVFLKEIENMFSVFLSSHRNTRESLGGLEKAVETLAYLSCSHTISPKLSVVFLLCLRFNPVSGLQVFHKFFVLYVWNGEDSLSILSPGYRLCDEPAPLVNGYRVGNEFWEGKNITYKCNKGYWLRGPFVRVCNEIGNWTEDEPTCEGTKSYKSTPNIDLPILLS